MHPTSRRPLPLRTLVLAVVGAVVAGLLVATPADAAPLKGRLTLSVSAKKITVGKKVTFTTKAKRGQFRRGDSVRLQQRSGRAWRTVRTTRLDRSGRSTTTVTPTLGTTRFRALRADAAASTASDDVPVLVERIPSSIALEVSDDDDLFVGTTLHLTGTTTKGTFDVGDPVSVEAQDGEDGPWVALDVPARGLSTRGRVEFAIVVADAGVRRYRLVREQTDRWARSTSQARWTNARSGQPITLTSDVDEVAAGEAIPLRGRVERSTCADVPAWDRSVSLAILENGQWKSMQGTTADDDCRFSLVTRARPGARLLRVTTGNTSRLGYGASNEVAVTVTAERPLVMDPDGRPTTFFVDEPDQVSSATFTAQHGQKYAIAADEKNLFYGADSLRVLGPGKVVVPLDSPPLDESVRDDRATRWDFVAAESGTFTVQVDPTGESTGHVDLQLSTPSSSAITPGSPADVSSGDVAGRELRLTFAAREGDLVSLSAAPRVHSWDPAEVRLVDPSSGESVPRRDGRWLVGHDGPYRFEVEPKRDDRLSTTASVLLARRQPLAVNRSVAVQFDRPDVVHRYRLDGLAGQQLTAAVSESELTVERGEPGSSASVELRASSGRLLHRVGGFRGQADVVVPDDGVIDVEASATGRGVGTYRLDLSTPVTVPVELDDPTVALDSGGLVGRELGVEFEAAAGDVVWPELDRSGDRSILRQDLVDLDTNTVVEARSGMIDDVWEVPHAGRYRLEHASLMRNVVDLGVRVRRARATTELIDDAAGALRLDVGRGDRIAVVRYTASRDETVQLAVTEDSVTTGPQFTSRSSAFAPFQAWSLDVWRGTERASGLLSGFSAAPLTLKAGTTYTFVLDAVRSGSLSLVLRRPSRRTVPAVVNGDAVALSDGDPVGRTTTVRFEAQAGHVLSLDLGGFAPLGLRQPLVLRQVGGDVVDSVCGEEHCEDEDPDDPAWLVPRDGTYEMSFELTQRPSTPVSVTVLSTRPTLLPADATSRSFSVDRPGGTAVALTTMPWWYESVDVAAGPATFRDDTGRVRVTARVVTVGLGAGRSWRLDEYGSSFSLYPLVEPDRTVILINPPGRTTGSVDLTSTPRERDGV